MDEDMNATPLSKLPPPLVQSRRPEVPHGMPPGGPSDGARKIKDVSAPTYAELLREMDTVAPPQHQHEAYEEQYPDPPVEPYPQQPPRDPPPQRARQPRQSDPPPPPHAPVPIPSGGLVWRHRYTILVAVIVMAMLMYGVPKLQVAAPTLFSPMTMYKLNVTGAAVVAVSSAGIYATLATYVL